MKSLLPGARPCPNLPAPLQRGLASVGGLPPRDPDDPGSHRAGAQGSARQRLTAIPPVRRLPLALLLSLMLPAGALHGQAMSGPGTFDQGIGTGVGYAGVLPDALLGASVFHHVAERGFGLFVDVKSTPSSLRDDDDYCPAGARPPVVASCTIGAVEQRWNDIPLRDVDEYLIVNAGGLVRLTGELALMVGGGMVRPRTIREFAENINREAGEEPRVSEFGVYFVPEEENPGWTPQLVVGALFRAGPRFLLRVGYETAPGGMSIGAYFVVR